MGLKKTIITREQFALLRTTDDWAIVDVPREHWEKIPGLERLHDTFAVMASGCQTPGVLNGIFANAGLDVLAHETKPKKDEPPGNAYHYVFQSLPDESYLMTGPFKGKYGETVVPHWFDADDLDRYWSES